MTQIYELGCTSVTASCNMTESVFVYITKLRVTKRAFSKALQSKIL